MPKYTPSTHARHDPPLAGAAIIRPSFRREPVKGMDVRFEHDGARFRIQGPYFLTPLDQSVLLSCIALAAREGAPTQQPAKLKPRGFVEHEIYWRLSLNIYRIGRDVYGRAPKGDEYRDIEESLDRLSAVSIRVDEGRRWGRSHLMSAAGDKETKDVEITLCWRVALALLGSHNVRISLEERRALKQDAAKMIHAWLSASLRPGARLQIGLDTLAQRIWGDQNEVTDAAARKRRQRVRAALESIGGLEGWQIEIDAKGIATACRLKDGALA